MKSHIQIITRTFIALLAFAASALAAPLEIRTSFRTLDREEKVAHPRKQIEKHTQALHITIRNTSGKELPAGEVDWAMLVVKGGNVSGLLTTGNLPLQALKNGETVTMQVGTLPVMKSPQADNKTESRVIVRHGTQETGRSVSHKNFDELAATARKQPGERKKNQ